MPNSLIVPYHSGFSYFLAMWRYTHQYLPQCRKFLNMHIINVVNTKDEGVLDISMPSLVLTYRLFSRSSSSVPKNSGSLMRFGNGGGTAKSTSSSSDVKSISGAGGLKLAICNFFHRFFKFGIKHVELYQEISKKCCFSTLSFKCLSDEVPSSLGKPEQGQDAVLYKRLYRSTCLS